MFHSIMRHLNKDQSRSSYLALLRVALISYLKEIFHGATVKL